MEIILIGFAYLLGSIPTGYLLGALAGIDIRKTGSGNVGATNVARVVGTRQGVFTLMADTAKGFIPVVLGAQAGLGVTATALMGIAAFLGHLFPVFLKFRGGKGVATALGVLLGSAPMATVILVLIFAAVVSISRIVSLGSMVTAMAAPLVLWGLSYPAALTLMSLFLGLMIVLRHRDNIRRLIEGKESKFGSSSQ